MEETDQQLLRAYLDQGSEDAFAVLVNRHIGLVHGSALRLVRDPGLAEEVTQTVFIIFAQKAARLDSNTIIPSWLYRTTRFAALNLIRQQSRQTAQLQSLADMQPNQESPASWEQIAHQLDEGMNGLSEKDRASLLLRFFQNKPFSDVAAELGVSAPAAKMRVGRALEKLRLSFGVTGAGFSAAFLADSIVSQASSPLHPAICSRIIAGALPGSLPACATVSTLVTSTLKFMIWNKTKKISAALLMALLLIGGSLVVMDKIPLEKIPLLGGNARMETFEPMAGHWVGTFEFKTSGGAKKLEQDLQLTVTTAEGGKRCEISMVTSGPPGTPQLNQHYAHTIIGDGTRVANVSDPASGRGDGEARVTRSHHNPAKQKWMAKIFFPLSGNRGEMECEWRREGDSLRIRSHDKFKTPEGTFHGYADLRLKKASPTL